MFKRAPPFCVCGARERICASWQVGDRKRRETKQQNEKRKRETVRAKKGNKVGRVRKEEKRVRKEVR